MGPRTDEHNAQTIYFKFKRDVLEMARNREKIAVPKATLRQRNLEQTLDRINNDESLPAEEKTKASGEITEKLAKLERARHLSNRNVTATRNRLEGETICTHWTFLMSFYSLRTLNEGEYYLLLFGPKSWDFLI
jgi:hypothetical protein